MNSSSMCCSVWISSNSVPEVKMCGTEEGDSGMENSWLLGLDGMIVRGRAGRRICSGTNQRDHILYSPEIKSSGQWDIIQEKSEYTYAERGILSAYQGPELEDRDRLVQRIARSYQGQLQATYITD